MKDIKVIQSVSAEIDRQERNDALPFHPLAFFAETVAMTRTEGTGVSIQDIAKCFKAQFDKTELESLIMELSS